MRIRKISYTSISSIIGYIITLVLLFYPTTSKAIMNLSTEWRILIIAILLIVPAVPSLSKVVYKGIKIRRTYVAAYKRFINERNETIATLSAAALEKHEHPTPAQIKMIIKSLNHPCFDLIPPDFNRNFYDSKKIRIPLSNDVNVRPEVRYLLSLPIMQRLRHIKQLSFALLIYPGAAHSRFEHSLGTMHLVQKICENNKKKLGLTDDDMVFR